MQSYKDIQATDIIRDSREVINDNIKTAISNNSGEEFPTDNLIIGMKCYRTDEGKTYTYNGTEWVADDSKADNATHATTADTCTGNSATATTLETGRNISLTGAATGTATAFDGSSDIAIPVTSLDASKLTGTASVSTTGNSATTTKLATARTLTITDGTNSGTATSFDGSANVSLRLPSNIASKAVIVAAAPNYYERSALFGASTSARTTITTPASMWLNVNDVGYVVTGSQSLNINTASNWDSSTYATAANRKGKDFYIYACAASGSTTPVFKFSANSTVPTGYTASTSRKLGGFHCLCADVGTISGHTLTGYVAGDILPASVWDLKHRPVASPEGMVYVSGLGLWVDIYLNSWNGSQLVSVNGGTIADGYSSKPFHGELFAEQLGLIGKRLPGRDEFIVAAKGSNECTVITGASDPGTTTGHKDSASRRMISNYGIEDCCGVMWQWTSDTYDYVPGTTISSDDNGFYLNGYSWLNNLYQSVIDSQNYGQCFGFLRRGLVGGHWGCSSYCGSRAFHGINASARRSGVFGGRGASEPLYR